MEKAVSTRNLQVVLGGAFTALEDITIDLPKGKITGLLGPSGAGKTTLIRCLVGRQSYAAGLAVVLGEHAGASGLRGRFSYMTQATSIYNDLTVEENLRYFAGMMGLRGQALTREVHAVLGSVDLSDKSKLLAVSLSGGQRQRLSLAIALLGDPELLFLDEPTVGLDPVLREQLWQLFKRLAKAGKTIVLSSHVMDEAEHCDELVLIRGGKVVAAGTPAELKHQTHSKTVEQSFLALVKGAHESL